MPLDPRPNESRIEFMTRCTKIQTDDNKKSADEAETICKALWDKSPNAKAK